MPRLFDELDAVELAATPAWWQRTCAACNRPAVVAHLDPATGRYSCKTYTHPTG